MAAELRQETQDQIVTQEEASAMIELWTRFHENPSGTPVRMADVCETLHISGDEATRLLSAVRRESTSVKARNPLLSAFLVFLYSVLALSVVYSALSAGYAAYYYLSPCIYRGLPQRQPSGSEVGGIMVAFSWVFLWVWYFRRPIVRGVSRVTSQVLQGKR